MSLSASNLRNNTVRKKIIEDHSEKLDHESVKGMLLATAVVLSTFGTAAVLSPESPTGDFSAGLDIENVEVKDLNIRGVETSDSKLEFVQDYRIKNPNLLPAEFEAASYRIEINGETVAKGAVESRDVIGAGQTEMLAIENKAPIEDFNGQSTVTVEGKKVFRVGEHRFEKYYREKFETFLP